MAAISWSPLNLIRVTGCARPDCDKIGTKGCSTCLKEFYCCADCQKLDWKAHKMMWNLVKRMPDTLVPFKDVRSVVEKVVEKTETQIATPRRDKYIKLLEHAVVFAEHQYRKRIEGKAYYERDNGDNIDNWEVEINILCRIYTTLGKSISSPDNNGDDVKDCLINAISNYQKSLTILGRWIVELTFGEKERTNFPTQEMIDYLLDVLSMLEYDLSRSYRSVNGLDNAQHYSEQSIVHEKQMKEGEMRIERLSNCLIRLGDIFIITGKLTAAKAV